MPSLRLGFEISGYSNVIIKEPSQPKRDAASRAAFANVSGLQNIPLPPEPDETKRQGVAVPTVQEASEAPAETSQKQKKQSPFKGGGYKDSDAPLVQEMFQLIEQKKANSIWDAAEQVVERAKGGGLTESKVKRLTGRFNKTFPGFSKDGEVPRTSEKI